MALVGLATEPVGRELVDVFLDGFARYRFAGQNVPDDGSKGCAVLPFIRMKAGKDRRIFVKRKRG
ncbi:MAG TPA: hypothetical protein VLL56_00865, partial [Terriglobia bacterium]|nr:hypothetical protein [Terriglobia bacterium]